MGPTASPSFDALNVGVCPDEWSSGSNVAYEEGDMVSLTVSNVPLRKVAYKCKAWPYSGYCGQFSPTEYGGDQGWALAGSCNGSIGPTASPVFQSLAEYGDGCPEDWSVSTTTYDAGDLVSLTLSTTPERKVVYKCQDWPNTGYCNQGSGFKPGTQYGPMAWTMMGMCEGTMAPTGAPVPYVNTMCSYSQCRMREVQEQCTPGSTGCSCRDGDAAGPTCLRDTETEICMGAPVDTWSSSFDYHEGDVVRVGMKRFKCREWPNKFWCKMEAYKPTNDENGVWRDAWTTDGMCPP